MNTGSVALSNSLLAVIAIINLVILGVLYNIFKKMDEKKK